MVELKEVQDFLTTEIVTEHLKRYPMQSLPLEIVGFYGQNQSNLGPIMKFWIVLMKQSSIVYNPMDPCTIQILEAKIVFTYGYILPQLVKIVIKVFSSNYKYVK